MGFGKVQNRKNIIEVPWLVLFLYNKMSIKNSFVQCPIVFVCDLWSDLWPDLWPVVWPVTWPVTCDLHFSPAGFLDGQTYQLMEWIFGYFKTLYWYFCQKHISFLELVTVMRKNASVFWQPLLGPLKLNRHPRRWLGHLWNTKKQLKIVILSTSAGGKIIKIAKMYVNHLYFCILIIKCQLLEISFSDLYNLVVIVSHDTVC